MTLPDELPILPLRDTVLFPNSFMPLAVARESSVRLIDEAIGGGKIIGVFTQRDGSVDEPLLDDLHPIGTASHVHKMFKLPDGSLRLIVQGLARVSHRRGHEQQALRPRSGSARAWRPSTKRIDSGRRAAPGTSRLTFSRSVLSPLLSDDLQTLASNIAEPGRLTDFIASSLTTIPTAVKQEVLEMLDVRGANGHAQPHPYQRARGSRARLSVFSPRSSRRSARTNARTFCASK